MTLQVDIEGRLCAMHIGRPEKRNATDADDYLLLSEAGKPVRDDPEIRGALISGADEKLSDSNGGEFKRETVLSAERVAARLAGLVGKYVIRTDQMEMIKAPVKQTQGEIEHARRIVRASDERVGAFGLHGHMYDVPRLTQALTVFAHLAQSSAVHQ